MINLVIKQKLIVDMAYISLRGFDNKQTINIMAIINISKLSYTPCNDCNKCPYDCNKFKYIVDKRNKTNTIPVPEEYNKQCYNKLEFIKT